MFSLVVLTFSPKNLIMIYLDEYSILSNALYFTPRYDVFFLFAKQRKPVINRNDQR